MTASPLAQSFLYVGASFAPVFAHRGFFFVRAV